MKNDKCCLFFKLCLRVSLSGFDGFDFYCMGKYILGLFCFFFYFIIIIIFLLYYYFYCMGKYILSLFCSFFYFLFCFTLLLLFFYLIIISTVWANIYQVSFALILGLFCPYTRSLLLSYQVSFAPILGLFCSHTRSLLPLYQVSFVFVGFRRI